MEFVIAVLCAIPAYLVVGLVLATLVACHRPAHPLRASVTMLFLWAPVLLAFAASMFGRGKG